MLKCFLSPNLLLFTHVAIAGCERWGISYFYGSTLMLLCLAVGFLVPTAGLQVFGGFLEDVGCGIVFFFLCFFCLFIFRFSSQHSGTDN